MKKQGLIDGVISEPLGGAHYDKKKAISACKRKIKTTIKQLEAFSKENLVDQRIQKYESMGAYAPIS